MSLKKYVLVYSGLVMSVGQIQGDDFASGLAGGMFGGMMTSGLMNAASRPREREVIKEVYVDRGRDQSYADSALRSEIKSFERMVDKLNSTIERLESKIDKMSKENEQLREENRQLRRTKSRGRS